MYEKARVLLQKLHRIVLSWSDDRDLTSYDGQSGFDERQLKSCHQALMKYCGASGNVTSALAFCDDIQGFSDRLRQVKCGDGGNEKGKKEVDFSMGVPEWKFLLVAASKSGHWRVCLSALQFLRPYVEATHFALARDETEEKRLERDFKRLEPLFNSAVECLAIRSQYAWTLRAIDDWIKWSGRRPPRKAVLAAIRSLARRGRGNEVNDLLVKCLDSSVSDSLQSVAPEYGGSLHVAAITAMYNEGMYDAADNAFVSAIARGILPFNIIRKEVVECHQQVTLLDLHGMVS